MKEKPKFDVNDLVWLKPYNVLGVVREVNPYRDGTPRYQSINHYYVYVESKGTQTTLMEDEIQEA